MQRRTLLALAVAAPLARPRAQTPRAVVDRVAAVAGEAVRHPDVSGRLTAEGAVVVADRPEEFARFVEADFARWERVAREGNIRVSG